HPLRHAEVSDPHRTQRAVHVGAEKVEEVLPGRATGFTLAAKPPQQQSQVKHDHLEAPFDSVGNAEIRVEGRLACLRHDGAVKGVRYVARAAVASEYAEHQRASPSAGTAPTPRRCVVGWVGLGEEAVTAIPGVVSLEDLGASEGRC